MGITYHINKGTIRINGRDKEANTSRRKSKAKENTPNRHYHHQQNKTNKPTTYVLLVDTSSLVYTKQKWHSIAFAADPFVNVPFLV